MVRGTRCRLWVSGWILNLALFGALPRPLTAAEVDGTIDTAAPAAATTPAAAEDNEEAIEKAAASPGWMYTTGYFGASGLVLVASCMGKEDVARSLKAGVVDTFFQNGLTGTADVSSTMGGSAVQESTYRESLKMTGSLAESFLGAGTTFGADMAGMLSSVEDGSVPRFDLGYFGQLVKNAEGDKDALSTPEDLAAELASMAGMTQIYSGIATRLLEIALHKFKLAGDTNLTAEQSAAREAALNGVMMAQMAIVMGSSRAALEMSVQRAFMEKGSPESISYMVSVGAVVLGSTALASIGFGPLALLLPGALMNIAVGQRGWYKMAHLKVQSWASSMAKKGQRAIAKLKKAPMEQTFELTGQEKTIAEAVSAAAEQSNCSVLFKLLAKGEMQKAEADVNLITTPEQALDKLKSTLAFQAGVYLVMRRIFKLMKSGVEFSEAQKLEIIKSIISPVISPFILIQTLNKMPFRKFVPAVVDAVLAWRFGPSFADYFFALSKAFAQTVYERVEQSQFMQGENAVLLQIFRGISDASSRTAFDIPDFKKKMLDEKENYCFARAINSVLGAVDKSEIDWVQGSPPTRGGSTTQTAFIKALATQFKDREVLRKMIDLGLMHCVDLLLRTKDESAIGMLTSFQFHIAHPRILALFLAATRPPSTLNIMIPKSRASQRVILRVYDELTQEPLKLRAPKALPVIVTDEDCERMLRGVAESSWDTKSPSEHWGELDNAVKRAVLDLILEMVYGLHPGDVFVANPYLEGTFKVQLIYLLTQYAKARMRKEGTYFERSQHWGTIAAEPSSAASEASSSKGPPEQGPSKQQPPKLERRYRSGAVSQKQTSRSSPKK